MLEKFRDSRAYRITRNTALSTVLAGVGVASMPVQAPVEAGGGCPSSSYGFGVNAGETKTFNAKRAYVLGDVYLNGERAFDDKAETGAVNVIKSDTCKAWEVKTDYGASVVVVGSDVTNKAFLKNESVYTNQMADSHGAADVYVRH